MPGSERRTYTPEQKAAAIARVLAGEAAAAVERDLDLTRGVIQKWMERDGITTAVASVVAVAPGTRDEERAERLRQDLSDLLHAEMSALIRQAEHYGSDTFLRTQDASKLLETTRTLRRGIHATLDRLAGRLADATESSAGD